MALSRQSGGAGLLANIGSADDWQQFRRADTDGRQSFVLVGFACRWYYCFIDYEPKGAAMTGFFIALGLLIAFAAVMAFTPDDSHRSKSPEGEQTLS